MTFEGPRTVGIKALCYIDEESKILEKATGEAHPEAGWIMDVERA